MKNKLKLLAIFFLSLLLTIFFSCTKRISASGTVFSKHHLPLEGAGVDFEYATGGKNGDTHAKVAITDKEGKFSFADQVFPRNAYVEKIIVSHRDSGMVTLEKGQFVIGQNMELVLR